MITSPRFPSMRRLGVAVSIASMAILAAPLAAWAQSGARYAVIVQGASGEEQYAKLHRGWVASLVTLLRDKFSYDAAHLIVLTEQPQTGELRASAENVRTALAGLAKTLGPADQLVLVFIGHGTAQGGEAKFNLMGPDLSVVEWKKLLDPIKGRIAVVATASSSFPFMEGLAAPGRVVITSTNSPSQKYHTVFPEPFVAAFSDMQSDLDKNGRVSLLEAFTYASRAVTAHFEQKGTMATENAMIDDTGDGKGRLASATGPDGSVAALTYLGGVAVATSTDPETQKLLARQQQLTEQVDELRRRQSTMPAAEYQTQFEQLMLDLASVSAEVRKRTGGR
jgi:hypothetical protein